VFHAYTTIVSKQPTVISVNAQISKYSQEIVRLRTERSTFAQIGRSLRLSEQWVRDCYYSATNDEPSRRSKIETSRIVEYRIRGKTYREIAQLLDIPRARMLRRVRDNLSLHPQLELQICDRSKCNPTEVLELRARGKTFSEIGDLLSCSQSTVFRMYHLATSIPARPRRRVEAADTDASLRALTMDVRSRSTRSVETAKSWPISP
jgi:hypothetical protein